VIPKIFEPGEKWLGVLGLEPSDQDLPVPSQALLDEASQLIVGLARGENDFGDTGASLAIGVEAGKAQVLDPARLQPVEDITDLRPARSELFQQLSDFVFVQPTGPSIYPRQNSSLCSAGWSASADGVSLGRGKVAPSSHGGRDGR
jgi:hypothetical protein